MSDVSLSVAVEGVEIKGGGQQTPPGPGYLSLCRLPAGQTGGEVFQYLGPPLEDQVMVRREEGVPPRSLTGFPSMWTTL